LPARAALARVGVHAVVGRKPLVRDGLVKPVPSICRRYTSFDFVNHRRAIVAVGHNDPAIPFSDVRYNATVEPPVAAIVAEVPALVALPHSKTHGIRADT